MPPLYLDSATQARVTAKTLASYQKAARSLTDWLLQHHLRPQTATEWDDLMVEWKSHTAPTKSQFSNALAALEYFFPQYKGSLKWAHSVKHSWDVAHVPQHTVPMLSGITKLYSVHCSAAGHPRLGIGMVLQQTKGLRPSELLGIEASDIVLPEEMDSTGVQAVIIGLGVRQGTKAKRPQSAVLPLQQHIELVHALRTLKGCTADNAHIFPYTLEQYNRMIKKISKTLNLDIRYTPHSLRAGFASEGRALGKQFTELREEGRWISDSSLRIYVDVVGAAAIAQSHNVKALRPAIAQAASTWQSYFLASWILTCDGRAPPQAGSSSSRSGASCAGGPGTVGRSPGSASGAARSAR